MQCWPVKHGALPPQVHAPLDEHPSLRPEAMQSVHIDPAEPHEVVVRDRHVAPLQHPLGHVVESHTHMPDAQRWLEAHGGPEPHAHAPDALQRSDRESHATQAVPIVPQVEVEDVRHVVPVQHPLGQLPAVHVAHAPETHAPAHAEQIAPPLPHADGVPPG